MAPAPIVVSQDLIRSRILQAFTQIPQEDVEAVGTFLLTLFPDIETELMAARLPKTTKRFSLGG